MISKVSGSPAYLPQECGGAAPEVVIGHSLGGKVALEWLRQLAADDRGLGLPKQVDVDLDPKSGLYPDPRHV